MRLKFSTVNLLEDESHMRRRDVIGNFLEAIFFLLYIHLHSLFEHIKHLSSNLFIQQMVQNIACKGGDSHTHVHM